MVMKTTTNTNTAAEKIACPKCDGKGYIAEYSRRDNGECYACHGHGYKGGKPRHTFFGEKADAEVTGEAVEVANARRYWVEAIAAAEATTKAQIAEARFAAAEAMQAAGLDPKGLGNSALAREVGMR